MGTQGETIMIFRTASTTTRWRATLSIVLIPFLCIWLANAAQATACMPDSVNFCPIKIVN
jgi:hypothetical protein